MSLMVAGLCMIGMMGATYRIVELFMGASIRSQV